MELVVNAWLLLARLLPSFDSFMYTLSMRLFVAPADAWWLAFAGVISDNNWCGCCGFFVWPWFFASCDFSRCAVCLFVCFTDGCLAGWLHHWQSLFFLRHHGYILAPFFLVDNRVVSDSIVRLLPLCPRFRGVLQKKWHDCKRWRRPFIHSSDDDDDDDTARLNEPLWSQDSKFLNRIIRRTCTLSPSWKWLSPLDYG